MSNSTSYVAVLNKISSDFNFYFNIISSSIGIPCNVVSMIIFWRLMRHKTNMGFLGVFQSAVDLVLLLLFLLVFRSSTTLGVSLASRSDSACKFLTFLRRFILHASSWIPVVTTFDRFVFVFYGQSQRFKFMKNKLILSAIIFVMFVVIGILDIPNLFFFVRGSACTADFVPTISSDMISICLRTYFPTGLMIFFNLVMIRKIFRTSRAVLKQTSQSRKEHQFTVAVIAFDAYFFLLNFPLSLYYIFSDVNSYSGALSGDQLFAAIYGVVGAVFGNLSFCEQTLSFFMYLAFNKLFRFELLRIFGIQRVQPGTQTHSIINTIH